MFSSVYTGAKKLYVYQVNCHLKFTDSLYSKIKQAIRSEDKKESKKQQQKKHNIPFIHSFIHNNEKKIYINFDMYQASNFCIFLNEKGERSFNLCGISSLMVNQI